MKALFVISSMNPKTGGPCQGIRNMIPEVDKFDFNNTVVCLDDPRESFVGEDPFMVIPLGPSRTAWEYSRRLQPWLLAHLHKFDSVVVHGLWTFHGYAVYRALKQLHQQKVKNLPRLFVMPHGMLDPYFQKAAGRKLKAIRNYFYWKLIEQKLIHSAEAILFTCQTELELARQSFKPYHPKNDINVGYGVPAPPKFSGIQPDKISVEDSIPVDNYLLFISRIHEKKGVELLIDAYMAIASKKQMPALVIAGPGWETEYGKKLRQKAATNKNIIVKGMLSGDAKWNAFYNCAAFILPSHQENFGIAVAEALACGKPVMISDQVNIWQEIKWAGAGLVHSDDLTGTKDMLEEFTSLSPEKLVCMEKAAISCYEKYFSVKPAAKKWVETLSI